MKKIYISPDAEVIRFRLIDAIMNSPTEDIVPSQGGGELPDPSDGELDDL